MANINEKLNYINETKTLIKDKLNDLGSEIDNETTFRKYAEKIENLYEEWPKMNDEDTTITLNNTKKGKMNLQLKGNTNQFATTGKNIFNYLDSSFQTAGKGEVDISIKDTVKLTCIETTTNTSLFYKTKIADNLLTNGITYIISSIGDNNVKQSLKLQLRNKDGSNAGLPSNNSIVYDNAYSLYVVGNPLAINNSIVVEAGTSCTIKNIMVRVSTTDTTYEPYTGGITSPNPDYPQDIEIVTGENTITISNEDNTENQTFNIDLGNLELYKIKNLQDYIYELNNKWFIYNNSGKILLDGINKKFENKHSTITSENKGFYKALLPNKNETYSSGATDVAYSNYYKLVDGTASNAFNNNDYGMWWQNTGESVYFILNETSLTDANNWLKTHNTLVYYILATPVITEITDTTLINQLNNLKNAFSYNNNTNILQMNENLPFIINVTALMKNSN